LIVRFRSHTFLFTHFLACYRTKQTLEQL